MSIPTKVTVEITANEYTTTVYAGAAVLSRRTMVMTGPGRAKALKTGDVTDDLPDFEDLAEEIEDMNPFGVAVRLRELQ